MPDPQRLILVGAGAISTAWIPAIQAEGLTVAAVVDLRPDAAHNLIEKYHLPPETPVFPELAAALTRVKADFLLDLTTPGAHHAVTAAALRAGLPVLGEKPMAATPDEAREMVRLSTETGLLYMVSQSRRYDDPHPALAMAFRDGALGGLSSLHCDFFIGPHFGGFRDVMDSPLLLDMAIHHFDLARLFTGADPVTVYAEEFNPAGSWYRGSASAHCLFTLTNDIRFTYRASWCAEGCATSWNGNWRFIGPRGTLLYENDLWPHGERVSGDGGFLRPTTPFTLPETRTAPNSMHGALREFLQSLRTGTRPQSHCADNIKSLSMVFAAIESARTGVRVPVS